jgi:hypothetical protein
MTVRVLHELEEIEGLEKFAEFVMVKKLFRPLGYSHKLVLEYFRIELGLRARLGEQLEQSRSLPGLLLRIMEIPIVE